LWETAPETFPRELGDVLAYAPLRIAFAKLEQHSLILEKNLLQLDFTKPDSHISALALTKYIEGLRGALDFILDLTLTQETSQ
jgi:hypothetical protein